MSPVPATIHRTRLALVVCCVLGAVTGRSQRPAHYDHPDALLVHAIELFQKAKYGPAAYELDRVIAGIADPNDGSRVRAEYHRALCAARLFNDDAPIRLAAFIADHPESQHVPEVRFELFRHRFAQRKWKDALQEGDRLDRFGMTDEEAQEFRFKRGYCHFQLGDRERALGELDAVKDGQGIYAEPALYYASHIHYERGDHETALTGFRRLEGSASFGRVVPFYIAEILFLQGKYDELDAYVRPLLNEHPPPKRINEINRLAGEANYRNGRYAEALPYLQKSAQRTGVDRNDRYILGYTYYRTGDHRRALAEFNLVANGTDSLAQLASYHMADCYLRLNEKNYARNAFRKAYELGGDEKVTEDALFQYAKLAYELSFDPYHEAIQALRNYLRTYPASPRRDEAYEFLISVHLRTGNNEAALDALDEIRAKDLRLKEAYQKLAYGRGVDLYEGRKYADAALFFERALKFPVNPRLNALAHYWMAASYYDMGEYRAALRKYDDLRNSPGAYATELYEQAGYGMGYTFFKLKEYDEAAIAFRRFLASSQGDARQRADAMLRTGDAYFVMRDNAQALKWYDDAARLGGPDKDYALFQKGVLQGLTGDQQGKVATLRGLLNELPGTRYAADAKFQLGEAFIFLENDAEAQRYYGLVLSQHPNSPLVHRSMLQSALVLKRQGRVNEAIEQYKAVVSRYPTMSGAKDALAGLEAIYVASGRVAEYEAYVRSLSFVDPATLELDEQYYQSAEKLYFEDKCPQAIGAFGDYLAKYPRGGHVLNAHFYRGDCLYRSGNWEQALPDLEEVIRRNGTPFMESASYGAADIMFRAKRWEGALEHFRRLETLATTAANALAAQVGQMRCLKELGRTEEAAAAAARVSANNSAGNDLKAEANLLIAHATLAKGDNDAAYNAFKAVSNASTGAAGAEAKFHQAYVRHLQARYRDCEKEVFELAQRYATHDYWKARAFILLGDVYVQLGDRFQAKATLQSVVKNSTHPELVAQARQRLDAIAASEAPVNAPAPQDDQEIELPTNPR